MRMQPGRQSMGKMWREDRLQMQTSYWWQQVRRPTTSQLLTHVTSGIPSHWFISDSIEKYKRKINTDRMYNKRRIFDMYSAVPIRGGRVQNSEAKRSPARKQWDRIPQLLGSRICHLQRAPASCDHFCGHQEELNAPDCPSVRESDRCASRYVVHPHAREWWRSFEAVQGEAASIEGACLYQAACFPAVRGQTITRPLDHSNGSTECSRWLPCHIASRICFSVCASGRN